MPTSPCAVRGSGPAGIRLRASVGVMKYRITRKKVRSHVTQPAPPGTDAGGSPTRSAPPYVACIQWVPRRFAGGASPVTLADLVFTQPTIKDVREHVGARPDVPSFGVFSGQVLEDPTCARPWVRVERAHPGAPFSVPDPSEDELSQALDALVRSIGEPVGQVVGWYVSHPGAGLYLSPQEAEFHEARFPRDWGFALVLVGDARRLTGAVFQRTDPEGLSRSVYAPFYELVDPSSEFNGSTRRTYVGWPNYQTESRVLQAGRGSVSADIPSAAPYRAPSRTDEDVQVREEAASAAGPRGGQPKRSRRAAPPPRLPLIPDEDPPGEPAVAPAAEARGPDAPTTRPQETTVPSESTPVRPEAAPTRPKAPAVRPYNPAAPPPPEPRGSEPDFPDEPAEPRPRADRATGRGTARTLASGPPGSEVDIDSEWERKQIQRSLMAVGRSIGPTSVGGGLDTPVEVGSGLEEDADEPETPRAGLPDQPSAEDRRAGSAVDEPGPADDVAEGGAVDPHAEVERDVRPAKRRRRRDRTVIPIATARWDAAPEEPPSRSRRAGRGRSFAKLLSAAAGFSLLLGAGWIGTRMMRGEPDERALAAGEGGSSVAAVHLAPSDLFPRSREAARGTVDSLGLDPALAQDLAAEAGQPEAPGATEAGATEAGATEGGADPANRDPGGQRAEAAGARPPAPAPGVGPPPVELDLDLASPEVSAYEDALSIFRTETARYDGERSAFDSGAAVCNPLNLAYRGVRDSFDRLDRRFREAAERLTAPAIRGFEGARRQRAMIDTHYQLTDCPMPPR